MWKHVHARIAPDEVKSTVMLVWRKPIGGINLDPVQKCKKSLQPAVKQTAEFITLSQ